MKKFVDNHLTLSFDKKLYLGYFEVFSYEWQNIEIKKQILNTSFAQNFHKYIKAAWILLQLRNCNYPSTMAIGFNCGNYLSSISIKFNSNMKTGEWIDYCANITEIRNIDNIILDNQIDFETLLGDLETINLREVSISSLKKTKISLSYISSSLNFSYNINYYNQNTVYNIASEIENIICTFLSDTDNFIKPINNNFNVSIAENSTLYNDPFLLHNPLK